MEETIVKIVDEKNVLEPIRYKVDEGENCPVCNSRAIESTGIPSIEGNLVTLDMVCVDCDSEYKEYYKLYKYEINIVK